MPNSLSHCNRSESYSDRMWLEINGKARSKNHQLNTKFPIPKQHKVLPLLTANH